MRKWIYVLTALVLILIVGGSVCWINRATLVARHLAKELRVPVKIASLDLGKNQSVISRLWVGNPRHSKTPTAFSSEKIEIDATWKEVRGDPLIVEQIVMEDIFVGVELYGGKDTNWSYILTQREKKKKPSSDYLIRKLIIKNLSVQVTQANGTIKTYPAIARMEFDNITSETGFPVEEIQKAIFNLMMKEVFRKFGLEQLNNTLDKVVPGGSPLKYLFK